MKMCRHKEVKHGNGKQFGLFGITLGTMEFDYDYNNCLYEENNT